ncbi:DMT family transporter [Ideonella sp. DXS29W]|uniref:DMT family transporter n=1 Tax=Ideonella lacteola TaxID=2984193 RepID=A0ABU9BW93_9BURK
MKPRDLGELMLLAAIWGASFLFLRMGAGEFGPFALAGLRVLGASAFLLPVLLRRGEWPALRQHWRAIALVGIANSAVPFLCFSYAALAITGGLSSIFNATTPLWGVLFAWAWLKDRPHGNKVAGLAIGFAGVLWLAWDKASFKPDASGASSGLAVIACLTATMMYGLAASMTKRWLTGVPPMALATGSQLSAAVVLAPLMAWQWPAVLPGARAWGAVVALALLCTGVAYVLYFRLIAHIGASNALSVTFLIPAFAIAWGWVFLGESVNATMLAACAVVLFGTSLVTGVWKPRWPFEGRPAR